MRLSKSDTAMVTLVVMGAIGLFYLYLQDIGGFSIRYGEQALGTITFKKLSATRKSADGFSWEQMRNNGPVYQADTLRTADSSEASVIFDDGTSLDILENSMLQLDFAKGSTSLDFTQGEITLSSSPQGSSYTLSSQAGTVNLDKDTQATFRRTDKEVTVSVDKGTASLTKSDGSIQTLDTHQDLQINMESGEAKLITHPITPLAPLHNTRFLHQEDESTDAAVAFAWEEAAAQDSAKDEPYTLEVSRTKDFDELTLRQQSAEPALEASLPDGTWYWRVRSSSGEVSPVRKFSITGSRFPELSYPQDTQAFVFRKKKPVIRFAWSGMDAAGAYLFEVSRTSDFAKPAVRTRTSISNILVDTLDAGTWYWRVSPIHSFTLTGTSPAIPVRSITIAQSGAMKPLDTSTPVSGTLYKIQEMESKGLSFAWMPDQEAIRYTLLISRAADLSSPIFKNVSQSPYTRIFKADCPPLAKTGTYYWGVQWTDAEGNVSAQSEIRTIQGIDGSATIRLAFPPDAYRIADSLVSNTRFTWKSSIAAKTMFQVASDKDFNNLVYQESINTETVFGKKWPKGSYWWRLRTYNADNTVFLDTETRSFEVVEPFAGPALIDPAPGSKFYIREGSTKKLLWQPVEHADYYSATLNLNQDGQVSTIFVKNYIALPELELDLGNLDSGSYTLNLQAFALSGPLTTKVIGYSQANPFAFKRLTYIKLTAPADQAVLSGLEARRGQVAFESKLEDPPDSAELIISRDAKMEDVVYRLPMKGQASSPGRLDPGRYYWTVKGTLADLDISALTVSRFDVLPIPPLPAPAILSPADGTVFDAARLRTDRTIKFSWDPVPGATHYTLTLFKPDGKTALMVKDKLASTSWVLQDLAVLDRGNFAWTVIAQGFDKKGELEQTGTLASARFAIDLPALKKTSPKSGKYYGK